MMKFFTPAYDGLKSLVINPNHVISVSEEEKGNVTISTTTGSWRIADNFLDVVARLNERD